MWKKDQGEAALLLWSREGVAMTQGSWVTLKAGRGKETDLPLEPPDRNAALLIP